MDKLAFYSSNMNEFKPGDFVKIIGQEATGEVVSLKGNDLVIAVGMMKITVKKNKVSPAAAPIENDYKMETVYGGGNSIIDTKEKLLHFKFELDVRGKMKDEVMTELASWTDDALLLGIPEAKVLHGRGNGILKNTARAVLRKYKEVESITDAPQDKGGENITIVKFKV